MVDKKRGVKANCANVQKAREVTAQRRAAEAAGPIEIGAQAGVIAAEAQAQAVAGAQLHQLQADLQHRELQLAHNQRMQQLQQQLQDLQRSELQRKEQQLADLVAQQRAALLQWEHQLTQRQHQLQQQQVDLSRREQDLTERKHQLQQQQAHLDSREQQQARTQTLTQQLHSLQQELKAQQVAEEQREVQQQQQTDLLLNKQQMEKQPLAYLQAISNNHPLPDPSPCSRTRHHIVAPALSTVCCMSEADVERMHKDVKGCRAMHRMVFTPDGDQPQWAMAGCACSTCMSVPCLPCMKPDTTTPLKPMPMFQDTVKEVREDEECYALLMLFHSDLLHDEVCFGKLTNKHCERYRMHMGWKREEGRRELRRWVLRELQSEELEAEYEADNGYGWV
ncbi:hypothetical protein QJQ45_026797 [Haematococcus lacustris]|nr:hypothetical protein QJQ45_026797 [Haematococcus lacustris]